MVKKLNIVADYDSYIYGVPYNYLNNICKVFPEKKIMLLANGK